MTDVKDKKTVNPEEAPDGYYALLKSAARPKDGRNICRACDWRPKCQNMTMADAKNHKNRCMDYAVIASGKPPLSAGVFDGQEVFRRDGCSVLFKRRKKQTTLFGGGK